jgi:hypothetical protein
MEALEMDREAAEWLDRIHAEQREVGEHVAPPAAEEAIAAVADFSLRSLGAPLPEGYAAFLRVCDGLDFNGTTLYATRQRNLGGGVTMLGLPEQNHIFRAGAPRHHLLLGETGDELFALDTRDGSFAILDRGSLSEAERFTGFDALLTRVLKRAFET